MKAVSQLYMAGLDHLVTVSNGQLLHLISIFVVHSWSGSSCNGKYRQLLNEGSISVVRRWSWSSCYGK